MEKVEREEELRRITRVGGTGSDGGGENERIRRRLRRKWRRRRISNKRRKWKSVK